MIWSNSFIIQAQSARDRLSQASGRFSVFSIRQLIIVRDGQQQTILPNPRIEQVSIEPDAIEGIDNLKGVAKKYSVSGVSKVYGRLEIEQEGTTFLIDGTIKCHLIPGTLKEELLSWSFQLEEVMIEGNLYV